MTLANGVLTVAGEVSMTTLDIGGTNVSATAAQLNHVAGVTSAIQTQLDTKASTGKAIAMAMVFG
jgi:signal recognition particle GTPase